MVPGAGSVELCKHVLSLQAAQQVHFAARKTLTWPLTTCTVDDLAFRALRELQNAAGRRGVLEPLSCRACKHAAGCLQLAADRWGAVR